MILDKIDITEIVSNIKKDVVLFLVKDKPIKKYAVFMEPTFFKNFGYDQLGFCITKTEEWLKTADKDSLYDAVVSGKIARVTRRAGSGNGTTVTTLMYIISSTFYNKKIGKLKDE
jgi:hypothetical protein